MSPTFFTDRDLGKQFPEVLRAAGLSVVRHADHFAPDAPDEAWLRLAGRQQWTAITHDGRIRYKPNELAAVVRHSVGLLVVVGHAPYRQLALNFVATFAGSSDSSRPRPHRSLPGSTALRLPISPETRVPPVPSPCGIAAEADRI